MKKIDPKIVVGQRKFIVFFTVLAFINVIVLIAAIIGLATGYAIRYTPADMHIVYLYTAALSLLVLSVLLFAGTAILVATKAYKHARNKNIELENLLGFKSDLQPVIAARDKELAALTYQKLETVLEAAPFGCVIIDEDIYVLGCNRVALQLYDVKDLEEYRKLMLDLSPERQPCGELSFEKRMSYIQQATDEGYVKYEWLAQDKHGTPIPIEVMIVCIIIDKRRVAVCYIRDMRQHYKQLEEERTANEHYNLMINTIPLVVNYWNKDHTLKGFNKYSLDYYNAYTEGVTSLDDAYVHVRSEVLEGTEWFDRLDEIFEKGTASFVFTDKTANVWEVEGIRTIYRGEPAAVTYGKNITKLMELEAEQRRREIAEESSKAKTMFIANISHEIRTPMNSILGYSELALEDESLSKNTREYLSMIVTSSRLLLSIVNDVLDISKIETGMLEFDEIPFTPEEINAQCRDLLQQKASEKGLKLNCKVLHNNISSSFDGRCILGDKIKIIQVCINILSNAIKFTKSGGEINATIEMEIIDDDNCTLRFVCRDTGIGMTEEQMLRVFEPFVQADTSTKREYGGTGLGLTIAKRLIEAMNSELHVQSTLGGGSIFSFDLTLPLVSIDEDKRNELTDETMIIKKPAFTGGVVLVVDDNEINLGVACEHLRRVGLTPAVARDGREAVEMVKKRVESGQPPYDLILMDLHMPEMDGREATVLITELNTGTPIIAMTAETITLTDEMIYEQFKMHGYLSKPFTAQKIWQCLLTHLKPEDNKPEETSEYVDDEKFLKELKALFIESNQNTAEKFITYLQQEDIKNAHMLVHSLKSAAKTVGKTSLGNTAEEVESQLKHGLPDDELVNKLIAGLEQALR